MSATSAWDGRAMLTMADIERAIAELTPPWIRAIRDADVVEVRVSPHADRGQAFTLDVEAARLPELRPMLPSEDRGRVLVVCHADDEATMREAVDQIRGRGTE